MIKNILKYQAVQIAIVAITAAAVIIGMIMAYICSPILNKTITGYLAIVAISLTIFVVEYCTAKAITAYTAK